jgi:pyruvate kinase
VEEIVEASDAVMVARGDLGIEISIEELPDVQRVIVGKCQEKGKRVIVATHLLESMIDNPIPTRAEVTDVSNAVYEEVDALMLSGETTTGKYPVRSIEHLDKIALKAESLTSLQMGKLLVKRDLKQHIAASAVELAESIDAKCLVVITRKGLMAQLTTNCRPAKTPIHAVTFDSRIKRQLCLNRAVTAHLMEESEDPEQRTEEAFKLLKQKRVLNPGDRVVLVSDVITTAGIDSIQLREVG